MIAARGGSVIGLVVTCQIRDAQISHKVVQEMARVRTAAIGRPPGVAWRVDLARWNARDGFSKATYRRVLAEDEGCLLVLRPTIRAFRLVGELALPLAIRCEAPVGRMILG